MGQGTRIWSGVIGGFVLAGIVGGGSFWLRSYRQDQERSPAAPVVTPTVVPDATPPGPTGGVQPFKEPPEPMPKRPSWSLEPLPAGTIQMERGRSPVTMTEPGLVRFDVQTGEVLTWHWSRSLSQYGADPVAGTDWASVRGLLIRLSTGEGYQYQGGELLWMGKEGALFQADRKDSSTGNVRRSFLLMDERLQPILELSVPPEAATNGRWRRQPDGSFRVELWDTSVKEYREHRIDLRTGAIAAVPPLPEQGYRLQQSNLFPGDCGGDGLGHQVKVYKGGLALYSLLDAVSPSTSPYGGSQLLADGETALISMQSGPALLRMADGTLRPAPELAALGSPYLVASPTAPLAVAAIPLGGFRGPYTLRTTQIGRLSPPQTFQLTLTQPPKSPSGYINSNSYWSADGRYLQVAVQYPDGGGKCGGGGGPTDTYLAPIRAPWNWTGPLHVRVKAATPIYEVPERSSRERLGAYIRTVAPGEVLTVKRITVSQNQSLFVVVERGGDGYLLPDPRTMEWVTPAP